MCVCVYVSVCVKFLCVCVCYCMLNYCVREAAGGEGVPEEPGIQNQKQEPHTKMWGKMLKKLGVRTTFGGSDVISRGRRTRLWILSKVRKT